MYRGRAVKHRESKTTVFSISRLGNGGKEVSPITLLMKRANFCNFGFLSFFSYYLFKCLLFFLQVINKLPVNANTSLPPFLVIWCGVVLRMGGDAWERLTFGMLSFICAWKLKHLLISISKVFCLLFNDMLWIIFGGNMTQRYFFKKCILSCLGYIIASSFIALKIFTPFF